MDDLFYEVIEEIAEDTVSEENRGWCVDNDYTAEMIIKKIREEDAEANRIADICKKAEQEYAERRMEVLEKAQIRRERYERMLAAYFGTVEHKKTKTKESYALASGTLVMKKQTPEIVRDNDKLTAWCKENAPEFVKVTESPNWSDLKKKLTAVGNEYVTDTGEIVEGVTLVPRDDVFIVEV